MASKESPEKAEFAEPMSSEKGTSYGSLTALAQAAATDHALTPMQAMRTSWRTLLWSLFVCIGPLSWGFDAQVGSSLLSIPVFRQDFGYMEDNQAILTAPWQSAFMSANAIGGMFGGLALGYVSDKLGRRGAVAVSSVISIGAVLIQFFTPSHVNGMFLAGKLINGFGLGMLVACASGYSAEVSPLALRGVTTATVNLGISVGRLLSNCVIRSTGNRTDAYAYRIPLALQWIFPVLLLVGLPFAPESPWWLVRNMRKEDAEQVLAKLGGCPLGSDAKLQVQQIQETIELEDSYAATATYMDCFRGVNRTRTIVAMMVFVLHVCAGVNFVWGYSSYFFELAGFADRSAFNLSIGLTAVGVFGNLLAFYILDRFGRRSIFNWGLMACTVILLLIGFVWLDNTNPTAKWAVATLTIIYTFIFQTSFGPIGYVIFAEVSSAKLRSKTVGIATWTDSLCSMVMNIVLPYLVNPDEANLGGYLGFLFGGLALAGTVWAWLFIPETKNRTVAELDLLFEKKVPAKDFATHKLHDTDYCEL
ncbi:hypothetical protein HYDPIDRAFT_155254 [Hydnomerulius pinastri MD-312]|uniref:Major facilitator superfamily (MFS) profile domain-containing protein n=1 Tax=Hydnomerulius pinastri MD-312 TaxID=994086 RepID=A0A0C9WEA3_9AGAM|nr:hypothetical protein HYDPIDRAFT_155254 [Hydnomerulius pinastri MD-312]